MLPRPFSRCLLAACLLAANGPRHAPAQAASPAPAPKSAFAVEEDPLSAEDLAKELGYTFYGCTYHFTEPVYARMKITGINPDMQGDDRPSEAPLVEPATRISLKILRHDNRSDTSGREPAEVTITYKVDLRGRDADRERAERLRAARALFSNALTDQFDTPRNAFAGFSTTQHLKGGPGLHYMHTGVGSGNLGVLLPKDDFIKKLADNLATPEGAARVADERAKWQAVAEAELLRKPVEVYKDSADMRLLDDEHRNEIKQRAEFSVVLEFSRQPFPDEEARKSSERRGDTGHGSATLAKPSPAATP